LKYSNHNDLTPHKEYEAYRSSSGNVIVYEDDSGERHTLQFDQYEVIEDATSSSPLDSKGSGDDSMGEKHAPPASTQAVKHDQEKPRMDLFSFIALTKLAEVLTTGAKKYSPHNWRQGFEWSRLLGAAFRHMFAWGMGQDKDPETGHSHIAHAMCNLMFLMEHIENKLGSDDRYKA
jgi:hypothetical protein